MTQTTAAEGDGRSGQRRLAGAQPPPASEPNNSA